MVSNARSTTNTDALRSLCFLVIAIAAATVLGQSPAPLAFEVASFKRGAPDGGVRGGCHGLDSKFSPNEVTAAIPLGRCRITDGRLSHLLGIAFRLRSMRYIQGGPDWIMTGGNRYTIEAKADAPSETTEAQILEMLQTLLIEHLKFHVDSLDKPGFALLVAKKAPNLHKSKSDK